MQNVSYTIVFIVSMWHYDFMIPSNTHMPTVKVA